MNEETWVRGVDYVARVAREESLPVINVHQALTRINPSGKGHGRITDAARAALRLGARNVVFHCPFAEAWDEPEVQEWLSALEQSKALLDSSGICLSIENSGINHASEEDRLLGETERLAAFAQQHDLCVTLDTCHAGTVDPTITKTYDLLSDRMSNVHLSDLRHGPLGGNHYLRGFFCHHQMLGEGHLPWIAFCRTRRPGAIVAPSPSRSAQSHSVTGHRAERGNACYVPPGT